MSMQDESMQTPDEAMVIRAGSQEAPMIVDVLTEAFRDYPVMRYVLGPRATDGALRRLVGFFVAARALRDEPMLAVASGGRYVAAATMSIPGSTSSPPELATLREEVWAELGDEARGRYEGCGRIWQTFDVREPSVHVNMVGVRPAFRGRGLARLLLEEAQSISRGLGWSHGVSLTTEDPANVPFYQHLGYESTAHARIGPKLETWGMFRRG